MTVNPKHLLQQSKRKFWLDFSERVGMTAAYAAVSEAIVELSDLNQAWAPIIMVGLNILKSLLAKRLNGTGGVATLPSGGSTPESADSQAA